MDLFVSKRSPRLVVYKLHLNPFTPQPVSNGGGGNPQLAGSLREGKPMFIPENRVPYYMARVQNSTPLVTKSPLMCQSVKLDIFKSFEQILQRMASETGQKRHRTFSFCRQKVRVAPGQKGYGIRTLKELFGHSNVQITIIHTHVAKRNRLDVRNPGGGGIEKGASCF